MNTLRNIPKLLSVTVCCAGLAGSPGTSAAAAPPEQSDDKVRVEVEVMTSRSAFPVTASSPAICRAFASSYRSAGPIAADSCDLPLPNDSRFKSRTWLSLNAKDNTDLVKEWTFWQFWQGRLSLMSQTNSVSNARDPSERVLLATIFKEWKRASHETETSAFRDPPADVKNAVALVWKNYSWYVLQLIDSGQLKIERAEYDLNGDGKVERVYRITELDFYNPGKPMPARPLLRMCRSGEGGTQPSRAIFISQRDNFVLNRAIQYYRTSIYQAFQFGAENFVAARPRGPATPGWIAQSRPGSYLSPSMMNVPNGAAIAFESACQFNLKEANR